jgi:hypothetical protein
LSYLINIFLSSREVLHLLMKHNVPIYYNLLAFWYFGIVALFRIKAFSKMTLSIKTLSTIKYIDSQHNNSQNEDTQHN